MDQSLLDDVIRRLLEVRTRPGNRVQLSESEVRQLCIYSKAIFFQQPNLLKLKAPMKVCGDIHGQYPDLLRLFEYGGYPPQVNYLFMGNYVDFGKQSLETMCLLLAFKIKYPENFFLLRGNHEIARINRIDGFFDECKRIYSIRTWKVFTDCFNCLPVAALIDERVLCVHGGLSPDLNHLDQIRHLPRPTEVPDMGLLCDLLFSDPCKDIQGWGMNDRGISTFGADVVSEFLLRNDLDLICRSNQVVEDGFEFFAKRRLVTVFSAPNFRGEYDNAGAMMSIDETLICSFEILKPAERNYKFNNASKNSSKFPSGPIFGSAAISQPRNTSNGLESIAEEPVHSRWGPNAGSTTTVKQENNRTGVKTSSNATSRRKPGSTPTDINTGTGSAASTRARPTRYSSPGGARALGEYVGQSAKAVTRVVSPFNPERGGRR